MDWLGPGVLALGCAVLLTPSRLRGPRSVLRPLPDEQAGFMQPGRWILCPKRGTSFIGHRQRARLRAAQRRRRVVVSLLRGIALTGLIGLFPPLRGMLVVTVALVVLLLMFLALVLGTAGRRGTRPRPGRVSSSVRTGGIVMASPEAHTGR